MASLDEAQKCPKCAFTGAVRSERTFPDRTKLLSIYCENERCSWYNTSWNVSVRSDGSIPEDCSVCIQYNGKNTINNRNGYYFNMDNSAGLSGYVIDVQKNGVFKVRGITNAGRQ